METKPEPIIQPGEKGKKWAIASFVLGIFDLLFSMGIVQIIWVETSESIIYSIFGPLGNFVVLAGIVSGLFLAIPFGLFSLITGIIASSMIKKSGAAVKESWMAAAGIVLGTLGLVLGILWWILFALHFRSGNLY
jgi:hypothetical protein